jgi:hypothetical protein
LGPTARLRVIGAVSIVALAVVALSYPQVATGAAALVLGLGVRAWVRGLAAATRVIALFGAQAHRMHLIDCTEEARSPSTSAVSQDEPGSRAAADSGDHAQPPQNAGGAEVRDAFTPAFRSVVALDGPSPSENKEQFA